MIGSTVPLNELPLWCTDVPFLQDSSRLAFCPPTADKELGDMMTILFGL